MVVVVQSLSCVWPFVNPSSAALQATLSFTMSQSLLKHASIESVMLSNYLILCCPFLLLPLIFPSIRVFSSESAVHIRWAKDWSFSFSISPSNEYSGLISLGSTGLICLQSKRLSRIFSSTTVQKHECMEPEANLWKISPNPVSHKKLFKGFHEFGTVQKFYIALPKTSYIVERIFPWLSITAGRKIKSINHAIRKIELSFSYMYNSLN